MEQIIAALQRQQQQQQQQHGAQLADVLELLQRSGGGAPAPPLPAPVPANPLLSPSMLAALQELGKNQRCGSIPFVYNLSTAKR